MKPRNSTIELLKPLICAVATLALIAGQIAPALAKTTVEVTDEDTKIIESTKHVENFYNDFGVCYQSTETSTTKQQTTVTTKSTDDATGKTDTKTTTNTTTSTSVMTSTWKSGSLKVDTISGTSTTTGDDGSKQTSTSSTVYTYNNNGQLTGASGTVHTTGGGGKDGNGKALGNYESDTVETYVIKNGQALRVRSETTGKSYGVDTQSDTVVANSKQITTYDYDLIGGAWHVTKEVSTSKNTNTKDEGYEEITKTKTYERDSHGKITNMTVEASGTQVAYDDLGGKWVFTMDNYTVEIKKPEGIHGWRIGKESYDWKNTSKPDYGTGATESVTAKNTAATDTKTGTSAWNSNSGTINAVLKN